MSGYCKYCGSLIDDTDMIRTYDDNHRLKWVGCFPCFKKQKISMKEVPSFDKRKV